MIGIAVFASGLVLALVAAVRLGAPARLDAKQADKVLGQALRKSGLRLFLLSAAVLVLAYTFDDSPRLTWLGLLFWVLAFCLHVLRRHDAASRRAVARACNPLLAILLPLTLGTAVESAVWIVVPGLALVLPLVFRRSGRRAPWFAAAALALSAAIAVLVWPATPDRDSARAFAEAYDAEDPRWDRWARIAQRTGGDFSRQAARIHAALDAGEEVSPFTLVEFARLGLLRDEDYAPFLEAATIRYYLSGNRTLGDSGELTIRGLLARGELTDDRRRKLARREVSGLPAYPDDRALDKWRNGLFALDALGARVLAWERAPTLPRVLEAHWSGRAGTRPYAAAFDDSPYPDEPEDWEWWVFPTADAVALMAEFGAHDGVDLDRVAAYLALVVRDGPRDEQRILAGLALATLEARFGVGFAHRIQTLPWLHVAALAMVLVAVLAVLRAPPLERGEEVHRGGDEPVEEHAGPDAVRA